MSFSTDSCLAHSLSTSRFSHIFSSLYAKRLNTPLPAGATSRAPFFPVPHMVQPPVPPLVQHLPHFHLLRSIARFLIQQVSDGSLAASTPILLLPQCLARLAIHSMDLRLLIIPLTSSIPPLLHHSPQNQHPSLSHQVRR